MVASILTLQNRNLICSRVKELAREGIREDLLLALCFL